MPKLLSPPLFFFFFSKVTPLGERCQAESHIFSKQTYIQVVGIKFSISSLNCLFLFRSTGVVGAVLELRVILWLSSSGKG